jgi:hypothetical protein
MTTTTTSMTYATTAIATTTTMKKKKANMMKPSMGFHDDDSEDLLPTPYKYFTLLKGEDWSYS